MKLKLIKKLLPALLIAIIFSVASLKINFKLTEGDNTTCYKNNVATADSGGVYDVSVQERGWPAEITRTSDFSNEPKSCNYPLSSRDFNDVGLVEDILFWLIVSELGIVAITYIRRNLTR